MTYTLSIIKNLQQKKAAFRQAAFEIHLFFQTIFSDRQKAIWS